MKNIQITNYRTGELIELPVGKPEDILDSLRFVQETKKLYELAEAKLKAMSRKIVDSNGVFEHGEYRLRISPVQRMTYDRAVLRSVVDEDTLDSLLKLNKTAVDEYIKENLYSLGEGATLLRKTMIPDGNPYETVKVEKI